MSANIEDIRRWHQRSERGRCVRCRGPIEDCQFLQLADEIEALRRRVEELSPEPPSPDGREVVT